MKKSDSKKETDDMCDFEEVELKSPQPEEGSDTTQTLEYPFYQSTSLNAVKEEYEGFDPDYTPSFIIDPEGDKDKGCLTSLKDIVCGFFSSCSPCKKKSPIEYVAIEYDQQKYDYEKIL